VCHDQGDADLWEAMMAGNAKAYEQFCASFLPRFLRAARGLARSYGLSNVEADDLFQEALLRTIKTHRGVKLEKPLGFLVVAARHIAIDWKRKENREGSVPLNQDPEFCDESRENQLDWALGQVNIDDREILVAMSNGSGQQAADDLGISREAAYKRYYRALERIRHLLMN
jgi:RNA polymerase sigma factor (sigma-70 family)